MWLGASLLRGLSPSRRKQPPRSVHCAAPFFHIQERNTQELEAGVIDQVAACNLQRKGAKKHAALQTHLGCGDLSTLHNATLTSNSDSKELVSSGASSIRQAFVICSQQEASTATPSFGSYDPSESDSNTNGGASVAETSSEGFSSFITNSNSSKMTCQPTHSTGTLRSGTGGCTDSRFSAAPHVPVSHGREWLRILNSSVRNAESLRGTEEEPRRNEDAGRLVARTQKERNDSESNSEAPQKDFGSDRKRTPPSAAEIRGTGQTSMLKTKFNLSRADSRSRMSRTLTAATGSVLRRLTPRASSRCSVQQKVSATPFAATAHSTRHAAAAAAVAVPARATVQVPCAALAALAGGGAAVSKHGACDTGALPVAVSSAAVSSQNVAVAAFGTPLTRQSSLANPTVPPSYDRTHATTDAPSTTPLHPSVLRSEVSDVSQSSTASCEMTNRAKEEGIYERRSLLANPAGRLFVESAGTAASAKLVRSVQAALLDTAKRTHSQVPLRVQGQPTVELRASSPGCHSSAKACTHFADPPVLEEVRRMVKAPVFSAGGPRTTTQRSTKGPLFCRSSKQLLKYDRRKSGQYGLHIAE